MLVRPGSLGAAVNFSVTAEEVVHDADQCQEVWHLLPNKGTKRPPMLFTHNSIRTGSYIHIMGMLRPLVHTRSGIRLLVLDPVPAESAPRTSCCTLAPGCKGLSMPMGLAPGYSTFSADDLIDAGILGEDATFPDSSDKPPPPLPAPSLPQGALVPPQMVQDGVNASNPLGSASWSLAGRHTDTLIPTPPPSHGPGRAGRGSVTDGPAIGTLPDGSVAAGFAFDESGGTPRSDRGQSGATQDPPPEAAGTPQPDRQLSSDSHSRSATLPGRGPDSQRGRRASLAAGLTSGVRPPAAEETKVGPRPSTPPSPRRGMGRGVGGARGGKSRTGDAPPPLSLGGTAASDGQGVVSVPSPLRHLSDMPTGAGSGCGTVQDADALPTPTFSATASTVTPDTVLIQRIVAPHVLNAAALGVSAMFDEEMPALGSSVRPEDAGLDGPPPLSNSHTIHSSRGDTDHDSILVQSQLQWPVCAGIGAGTLALALIFILAAGIPAPGSYGVAGAVVVIGFAVGWWTEWNTEAAQPRFLRSVMPGILTNATFPRALRQADSGPAARQAALNKGRLTLLSGYALPVRPATESHILVLPSLFAPGRPTTLLADRTSAKRVEAENPWCLSHRGPCLCACSFVLHAATWACICMCAACAVGAT